MIEEQEYKKVYSFKELFDFFRKNILEKRENKSQKIILFFDIQGVLIKNNNFHEALVSKSFEKKLKDMVEHEDEHYIKVAKFGRFFKSRLTEDILPILLSNLREIENTELCLLTFARYSLDREAALKSHNILQFFHKQIWTGGVNKGLVMTEYLKNKHSDLKNISIIFIDDKIAHLKSVEESLRSLNNITINLFLYCKDPVLPVTEQEFDLFWKNIIYHYKTSNKALKR